MNTTTSPQTTWLSRLFGSTDADTAATDDLRSIEPLRQRHTPPAAHHRLPSVR